MILLERELNRYKAISAANKMKVDFKPKIHQRIYFESKLLTEITKFDEERNTLLRTEIGSLDSEKEKLDGRSQ